MNGTPALSVEQVRNIMRIAARCADCADPACMKACPEQIDLGALFKFIASQAPLPVSWTRPAREAEDFAAAAIERSFA